MRILYGLLFVILSFLIISCSSNSAFTDEEKAKARLFNQAQNADFESIKISNSRPPYSTISEEDINEMLRLKKKALSIAEEIPDNVLRKIHKDLPIKYAIYKQALSLRIQNLEKGDMQAEIEGSKLMDEFINWYDANRNDFKIPK